MMNMLVYSLTRSTVRRSMICRCVHAQIYYPHKAHVFYVDIYIYIHINIHLHNHVQSVSVCSSFSTFSPILACIRYLLTYDICCVNLWMDLSVKIAIELLLIFTNENCSNVIFVVFIYFSLYMFGVKLFCDLSVLSLIRYINVQYIHTNALKLALKLWKKIKIFICYCIIAIGLRTMLASTSRSQIWSDGLVIFSSEI